MILLWIENEANPVKTTAINNIKFVGIKSFLIEKYEPLLRTNLMWHRTAITLESTLNFSISNYKFTQLRATAIVVAGYIRNTNVIQSQFEDISRSEICFFADKSAIRLPIFKCKQLLDYNHIDTTTIYVLKIV